MRRCTMVVVLSLLLSAGFLLLPVNAEDHAGPDTSGSDLDIGAIAVGMLDNDMGVIMSPPRWQWNADRYLAEGRRCAAQCETLKNNYVQSPENSPDSRSTFDSGLAFCECAQKNYNKAYQLTKDDDYKKHAEIFDAGNDLYTKLGMTKEADQMANAAAVARAHDAASGFFLPLPPWLAMLGIIGGIFLLHRRRT
jgi:hypothetical protein